MIPVFGYELMLATADHFQIECYNTIQSYLGITEHCIDAWKSKMRVMKSYILNQGNEFNLNGFKQIVNHEVFLNLYNHLELALIVRLHDF